MKLFKIIVLLYSLVFSLQASDLVHVNFSDTKINEFIKIVSNTTNKNILVNDIIDGKVNLISNKPIKSDDLMDILVSVIESKGYTLIYNGSVYEVVKSSEAISVNPTISKNSKGSFFTNQYLKINFVGVDYFANKIKPLLSKHSNIITFKSSNILLITDYPKNIDIVKNIIKNIDVENSNIVKIIPIKNVELKNIKSYLVDISKMLFNKDLESDNVKILSHDNQNSIILIGSKNNIDILATHVKKFDIASNLQDTTKIFNLKNSKADNVLKSLQDIVNGQTYLDESLKPNISISGDINSVIVVGKPTVLNSIGSLIKELDREKYQVYVEARIIEINEQNTKELGVKYGFHGERLFSNGGLLSFAGNFGGVELSSDLLNGFVGNYFALSASLDFLQTKGVSKSVSNPSILCVNNKESKIYVGKTISVSTGSVSTSNDNGVTNSFTRENVGLTLKITPRVSSNDKVTLDIETILENLIDDGSNNATNQPVTSKQEVNTQAILRHGEPIIIGGLVKGYELKSRTQVPLFGSIPFLGSLFTSDSVSYQKDNLVVILTPYIIDKSEKLSKLQNDLGELSKLQDKYNLEIFSKIESEGFKND